MKKLTLEWIDKADLDLHTALRESRCRKNPNYDAVCFHAQQCCEKYLKALMQENGIIIEKTHNLIRLLEWLLPIYPFYESLRRPLNQLNAYAVTFRYPGESATKQQALKALKLCRSIRKEIRFALGMTD
jgi:HEPN domain-containing protein